MYYLDEEPKPSPVRKFLIFLLLLTGAYFGMQKWAPAALEKAMFWKKTAKAVPGPDIRIEPAPSLSGGPVAAPSLTPPSQARPPASTAVDKTAQVAVLLYHRVDAKATPALRITPAVFEEHMEKLKTSGITVISMQDFLAWKRGEKSIPARSAMITIDDGFSSAYEVARPILKKYGYPWTCFVYTDFISRGSGLTWEQLAELRDEGVEIGCHSASHKNLRDQQGKTSDQYDEWLKQEIVGAKQMIEQRLGIRCATYAYPFGSYSPRVQEIIRQADYEAAFTLGSLRTAFSSPSDRIARYSWLDEHPELFNPVFSWSGKIQLSDAPPTASAAPVAPAPPPAPKPTVAPELLTQPLDGEVIRDPQPVLQANLTPLGAFDPNFVTLRLSGAGSIPHTWTDAAKTTISARIPKALTPGEYTWSISTTVAGKRVETQFKFRFDPTGGYDDALTPAK